MQYRSLGRSDLKVSRLILGSTMFGEVMDEPAARSVFNRASDLGVNTFDTADIYACGRSEEIVGRLIQMRRQEVILCTKVGFRVGDTPADHTAHVAARALSDDQQIPSAAPVDQGLSRRHIVAALEASLRRLRTDYVDLYQIHRWDPAVPIEETLRALDDLVSSGKVRCVGCSNARGWQLNSALWTSDTRGLVRFESMQVPYSLLAREAEHDALPACERAGIGVIAYQVLAAGALSGAHNETVRHGTVMAQRPAHQARFLTPDRRERLMRFAEFARRRGKEPATLALAAALAPPVVTAATVGVQTPDELKALLEAIEHPPDEDDCRAAQALFA
jgi:aryl-alcohol dehydrogenase-like predicted oxidoreductase